MKLKKRKKRSRIRGRRTVGKGSRKKARGKGHRGGKGMAGTGKRAGQKLTLVQKYYKGKYLGKKGFTSHKKLKRKKEKFITIQQIISMFSYDKNKKIDLSNYKVLGANVDGIELLKDKEIVCKNITNKARGLLEKYGIKISVIEKKINPENV